MTIIEIMSRLRLGICGSSCRFFFDVMLVRCSSMLSVLMTMLLVSSRVEQQLTRSFSILTICDV